MENKRDLTSQLLNTFQHQQPLQPLRRSGLRGEACFSSPGPWTPPGTGSLQPPEGPPDQQSGASQPFSYTGNSTYLTIRQDPIKYKCPEKFQLLDGQYWTNRREVFPSAASGHAVCLISNDKVFAVTSLSHWCSNKVHHLWLSDNFRWHGVMFCCLTRRCCWFLYNKQVLKYFSKLGKESMDLERKRRKVGRGQSSGKLSSISMLYVWGLIMRQ